MHAIAYAKFNEEAGRLFKDFQLFNQACVYPVLARTDTEVVIETHPCPRLHSEKMAIPTSMIAAISENPITVVPPGTYMFAPSMLAFNEYGTTEWPRGISVRDNACRVEVKAQSRGRGEKGVIQAIEVDFGTVVTAWGIPTHWLIPCAATIAPQTTAATPEAPAKPKFNHPGKDDKGKYARYIKTDNADRDGVWYIYDYDTYHNRCRLYNSLGDHYAKCDQLELVDMSWLKRGALCTQGDKWMKVLHPLKGATGHPVDHTPHLLICNDVSGNGRFTVYTANSAGAAMKIYDIFAGDVRPLTEQEAAAWKQLQSKSRDEKWLRAATPRPVMVMIDKHPASPFTLGIITATLGVALASGTNTTETIIAGMLAQAANIKLPDTQAVTMEMLGTYAPPKVEPPPALVPAGHEDDEEEDTRFDAERL